MTTSTAPAPDADDELLHGKPELPLMTCGGIEVEYRPGDMTLSEDWLDDDDQNRSEREQAK
jgi:hypothetical protein